MVLVVEGFVTASEVGDIIFFELTTPTYFEFDECSVEMRGEITFSVSIFLLLLLLLPTEISPWTE